MAARGGLEGGMTPPILQSRLPFASWMDPRTARLPGILPIEGDDWLRVDDAFAGQMAERDRLIATRPEIVHGLLDSGHPAAAELYATVLARLARTAGYRVAATEVQRPDGVVVPLDPAMPLITLGRLVQEDLCLMEKHGDAHVLTGAVLCFPASWYLPEKLGRPLLGIHIPVPSYDPDIARRVQRLFDAIRPEQPLWRANALVYRDPTLHQPRREGDPRTDRRGGSYVRSERQCLLRLPETRAVVFSIHSYVVDLATLSAEELAGLDEARL
jgi:dimethylamine monooxygenase subunit A